MRSKLFVLLLGLGLASAATVPTFACPYQQSDAASDKSQQTAQTQPDRQSE